MKKTRKEFIKENKIKAAKAYAETSGDFFTSLRKRLALAAASSRLVAAAAPLSFFGLPPSELSLAWRLFTPP